MFRELTNVKYLDLSNNQLVHLTDGTFSPMSQLVSIKLHNNSLYRIDDFVFAEFKLEALDLSFNKLSDDNFIWPIVTTEYLNLTYNEYESLNASVLENIVTDLWGEVLFAFGIAMQPSLDWLGFPGNPFDCEWLVREVLASKNIRLGRNYSVDSAQRVLKVEGIQCFDDNKTIERRLVVIETKLDQDEVGFYCFKKFPSMTFRFYLNRLRASVNSSRVLSTSQERLLTTIMTTGQFCFGCRSVALEFSSHWKFSDAFSTTPRRRANCIEYRNISNSRSKSWRSLTIWNEVN